MTHYPYPRPAMPPHEQAAMLHRAHVEAQKRRFA